jgi:hypothetical protein
MDIICKECGMIYVSNEIPEELICLCKNKEFKINKNLN